MDPNERLQCEAAIDQQWAAVRDFVELSDLSERKDAAMCWCLARLDSNNTNSLEHDIANLALLALMEAAQRSHSTLDEQETE